ncbi:Acetyltransferase involved in cellulose biosynthesis, CelD/BcsL family [Dyella sp. OK004]|uniref:GNAT family N-acetyltransferase n=1 Tax=Dyella sp. OK004 TaxID=1855292 RepID=UPI0008E3F6FC|nr:GNAT family N-acetyltransferase [Dyella sp. OK004]SFS16788.1 Acetyltransferase involved in cellulose biosynthesis, CelD/BcsL family [Dyella sp. OK004]
MTLPRPACVILDHADAVRHLRDELARLAERPGAASSIVQHPDWLLFELESREGAATPYVVVASGDNGKPIGYAPFVVEYHHARIAVGDRRVPIYQGRTLRLLGAGVVASPHDRPAAEASIAEALKRDRSIHVLRIRETELPNTLANAVSMGRAHFTTVQANLLDQINWTIEPQESLDAYLAGLGSKRRNDLTRRLRNVYKKLGEQAQLRVVDTPEQVDEYCTLMNQVYARSWHAEAVAIDWTLPARRALFRQLASERCLIGHLLMLGDQPIAYVHGYRLAGRYLLDDTGYDEAFAAHGVGSALVFQAVQDLLARYPGEVIDFGYGDNQYKRVLANRQVSCGALYMVRGVEARARFGMIAPLRWVYRGMRRVMRRE